MHHIITTGWNSLNFVVQELVDPPHNMPRALLISVPVIIICYILANIAFFSVLHINEMADFADGEAVPGFATTFGQRTLGLFGQIVFPIMIATSAFSSLDGDAFVGTHHGCDTIQSKYYLQARGLSTPAPCGATFPRRFGRCTATRRPRRCAHLLLKVWLASFRMSSFNLVKAQSPPSCCCPATLKAWSTGMLASACMWASDIHCSFCVASWLFYFAAGTCVLRLRRTEPTLERPFRYGDKSGRHASFMRVAGCGCRLPSASASLRRCWWWRRPYSRSARCRLSFMWSHTW